MRIISRPAVPLALAALLAAGLTAGIAPEARAQGEAQAAAPANAEAAAIFRESASAMRSLKSLSAKVNLSGAGGFASVVPTAKGTVQLARNPDIASGPAWHERVDASYKHTSTAEQQDIKALRTPDLFIYVDHEKKAVQERPRTGRSGTIALSALDLLAIPELTSEVAFDRELNHASGYESLGREEVNGVQCDVVQVRYDMSEPEGGSRNPSIIRTPAAKWYLGVDDRLPRRVERITDEGMINFTIILDINELETNTGLSPASLAIETPEGYSRTVTTARTPGAMIPTPATDAKPETPSVAPNPVSTSIPAYGFELVDGDGNEVSLDSLKGKVAVLYFWGTWCVPCRNFSPLVSDLVTTFEGQPVEVFGLPVRERDEQAVRDAMSKYDHTLLLNPSGKPIGCDETARAYKVRRYPTVYVIGPDSTILSVKFPEAGVEPAETMAQVEKTIRDALASMN